MIPVTAEPQFAELASIIGDNGRTIPTSDWHTLEPDVAAIFPVWYRTLLERYPLAGVSMDIDTEKNQIFSIRFAIPEYFSGTLDELMNGAWDFPIILASEYFPFCLSENGDTYVVKRELPSGVFEFRPKSDGGDGFIPGVADFPQWEGISDFVAELIPEGYDE